MYRQNRVALTSTCGSALYRHAIVMSSPGDVNGTEDVAAGGAAAEGDGAGSLTSSAGHDCEGASEEGAKEGCTWWQGGIIGEAPCVVSQK